MGTVTDPRTDVPPETSDPVRLAGMAPDDALRALGSCADGLVTDDAEARLRRDGPNRLPEPAREATWRLLLAQLTHFFAVLLWAAAVLAWVAGMPQLAVAIAVVVVVNGVFSFAQEERAERATRALAQLLPSTVTVMRDGHRRTIEAAALVAGDVMLLREGDRISADGRLLRTDALMVDESTLTGESVPVERDPAPVTPPATDPLDARPLVFAGTYVSSGAGRAVVVATGERTRLGAIARLTGSVVRRTTPLQVDLHRAVRVVATFAVTAGVAFFGASLLLGATARDGFLFGVGVIVALVPEGLLPTLTLSLSMSATRMAHHGALARHLESVETLGATTVVCSDKTGTMTTNQMTVRAVRTRSRSLSTSATGWAPGGTLLEDDVPLDAAGLAELAPLLRAAALCGNARLEPTDDGRWRCVGDPTEGALLALAAKGGITRQDAARRTPRIREFPFGSERRRMSTLHRLAGGDLVVYAKGSPEAVLAASTTIRVDGGTRPLDAAWRGTVLAWVDDLAGNGLRVLALARRRLTGDPPDGWAAAERDLELLGVVGLEDPVRPHVPDAVGRCLDAGIRVLMVTGDHPATAHAVATAVGVPGSRVVLGADLPDDDALPALLADPEVGVLARIAPEQKLRIARALQANGEVVAMTGDGVNDAPALRQADIGVAMGIAGTDVAREAADLVLLDDDFAHIVEAVEEGRAAFDNIRRFLTYHLTDNVAELAPFAMWALSAGRIPLMITLLQVLALDIGTDLLPALALGAERPERGVMDRAPRATDEHLLDRHVLARAFGFLGPIEATLSMLMLPVGAWLFFGWTWGAALPHGSDHETLSAMVFSAIVTMQMANAYACRSDPASLWSIGPLSNHLLNGAIGVEVATLLAFVYVPFLYGLLGGQPLTALEWLPVLVTPFLLLGAEEARKAWVRRRYASSTRR